MQILDDSYDGLAGFALLPKVAKNFDFGPKLPAATFPADFVTFYASFAQGEPVNWAEERRFFLAEFDEYFEVCMYCGLFSPQSIQAQNSILSDSAYVEGDPDIMPRGWYAIGNASGEDSEFRIMVNLVSDSPDYGSIAVWNVAHDALGTGDNTRGLGFVADTLQAFIEGLQLKDAL